LPAIWRLNSDRAGRGSAHRRRFAHPGLFPHLPPADGARAGRGRHLRAAAGVERVSVPVPAAVVETEHDGAGGIGAVPQQRRGAVELHDGDCHRLCAAAGGDLLRLPPPHDGRPHHGRRQGLIFTTPAGSSWPALTWLSYLLTRSSVRAATKYRPRAYNTATFAIP